MHADAHTLKIHTLKLHIENIRGTKKTYAGQGHLPISEAGDLSNCFFGVLKI